MKDEEIIEKKARKWKAMFSYIPTELVKQAYREGERHELKMLIGEEAILDWPCGDAYLYMPDTSYDEDWIRKNLKACDECGFIVFETREGGVMIAVDGMNYDIFTDHWIPLYKKRGFNWHKKSGR